MSAKGLVHAAQMKTFILGVSPLHLELGPGTTFQTFAVDQPRG